MRALHCSRNLPWLGPRCGSHPIRVQVEPWLLACVGSTLWIKQMTSNLQQTADGLYLQHWAERHRPLRVHPPSRADHTHSRRGLGLPQGGFLSLDWLDSLMMALIVVVSTKVFTLSSSQVAAEQMIAEFGKWRNGKRKLLEKIFWIHHCFSPRMWQHPLFQW